MPLKFLQYRGTFAVGTLLFCSLQTSAQAPLEAGPPVIVKGFPPSPLGQVPVSVIKITNWISPSEASRYPSIEFQNTGSRGIRAVVLRLIDLNAGMLNPKVPLRGQIQWWIRPTAPLAPLERGVVVTWPNVDAGDLPRQIEIAAVIFADGSHLGSAPDPIAQMDTVSDIFSEWQGSADAVAALKQMMASAPQDDHGWVAKFLSLTEPFVEPDMSYGSYAIGAANQSYGLRELAKRTHAEMSSGLRNEISARQLLEQHLNSEFARATAFAADLGTASLSQEVSR